MNSNLLHEAIKELAHAVLNWLHASDGNDDHRIVAMQGCVDDLLTEARKTPALHDWAEHVLAVVDAQIPPELRVKIDGNHADLFEQQ
jgi:hypothetical protein